jgi:hypothetical protein
MKYVELSEKVTLGKKRNIMHSHATGSIIVYMDDDDYYPPDRVEHAVDRLTSNKEALCAGGSEIYIYFKHIQKMYQCGPYGPNHATAGTFAFKRELLDQTKYDETAELAEEKAFLKNYTIPFVQLDPLKTILVFSHEHNTFDKRKLLENPHPQYCKESPKTVDMFIRQEKESAIKRFFLKDIDILLANYAPGFPSNKPGVLEQIKKIEKERNELNAKLAAQQGQGQGQGCTPGTIMMSRPDGTSVPLTQEDILNIIKQQQHQLQAQQNEIQNLNKRLEQQNKIIDALKTQVYGGGAATTVIGGAGSKTNKPVILGGVPLSGAGANSSLPVPGVSKLEPLMKVMSD